MPEAAKILGQASPDTGVLVTLYEVPLSSSCVVSSLVVCNRGGVDGSFRAAVAVGGAADSPEQYVYFDQPVDGNSSFVATIGITLGSLDILRAQAGSSNMSFNLFGIEVS